MPSSTPASPDFDAIISAIAADARARYGVAVIDVGVEPTPGGGVRAFGATLLERQKQAVLEALRRATPEPVADEIDVLSDATCPALAWVAPLHEVTDLRRLPREDSDLSSQALAGDAPLRLLWRQDPWRLVQMHDLTLGWVHVDEIREVATPFEAHPWEGVRRAVPSASVSVDVPVERLLEAARARVGQPYRLGGTSTLGLDCSALVQRIYWDVAGLLLPKHTGDQRRLGVRMSRAAVAPGDLLFFKSRDREFGHVALALDDGAQHVLHASMGNGVVAIEPFEAVQAVYAYLGARRVARFAASPAALSAKPPAGVEVSRDARVPVDLGRPETLRGWNVHVVGLAGAEGAAVARFLVHHGVTNLTAHDSATLDAFEKNVRLSHVGLSPRERTARVRELLSLPMKRCLGGDYLEAIEDAEVVFLPQGWFLYPANDRIRPLRESGTVIFSQMTELYFRLSPCPIAAVTGTNGKSTTTRLLSDLVGASPRPHLFAGNDRRNVQVLDQLETFDRSGVLVLEVSNRQLIDLAPRPHVAIVTNVTPDHVEEHGSFARYIDVKRKLVAQQTSADHAILNADDPVSSRFETAARVLRFSLRPLVGDGAFLDAEQRLVLRLDGEAHVLMARRDLPVRGDHNVANALAASLAARVLGVDIDTIRHVLASFQGIQLRLQRVAEIEGVAFYNDVKATTPEAALAAVSAFDEPLHVIVGGGDKGLDYARLAQEIVKRARHLVVLESPGGTRVSEAVTAAGGVQRISTVSDLATAVATARAHAAPGDVVLLSPACPGMFSMFMDETRGFNALVRGAADDAEGRPA